MDHAGCGDDIEVQTTGSTGTGSNVSDQRQLVYTPPSPWPFDSIFMNAVASDLSADQSNCRPIIVRIGSSNQPTLADRVVRLEAMSGDAGEPSEEKRAPVSSAGSPANGAIVDDSVRNVLVSLKDLLALFSVPAKSLTKDARK